MTEAPQTSSRVPEWTLGDRMRKAREHAGLEQTELAHNIGIGRSSIVRYEKDKTVPARPVLLSWAMATGVPFEWLRGGEAGPTSPDPGTSAKVSKGAKSAATWPLRWHHDRSPIPAAARVTPLTRPVAA